MYIYDEYDQRAVDLRVEQFRDQVQRRIAGDISEEHFKPLRLQNGLYMQLHGYMLRVAIPYGVFSAAQLEKLAEIADRYDRGYGHFTTRQNIQYNWIKLNETPDLLGELATVQMHALQTSGNCIRNVTSDPLAGVANDEEVDPRPYAELLRQWSSQHAELLALPRKFKIAVSGALKDRAAVKVHDIGLYLRRGADGEVLSDVWVGGGQGRTPRVARLLRSGVSELELIPYIESALRVYNLLGRRDHKYKARIKVLVDDLGIERFRELTDGDFAQRDQSADEHALAELRRIEAVFDRASPVSGLSVRDDHVVEVDLNAQVESEQKSDIERSLGYQRWYQINTEAHRDDRYRVVWVPLKPAGGIPGDISSDQMRALATIARRWGLGEVRASYDQNLLLPYAERAHLSEIYQALSAAGLADPHRGLISDVIACPGLDYCSLATTRSIPMAQQITSHFERLDRQLDIGPLEVKISGCINACGHHHVGHVGILGVDKRGEEYYQLSLGGRADHECRIGKILGRALPASQVVDAFENLVRTYIARREPEETFLEVYERLGAIPFYEAVYGETPPEVSLKAPSTSQKSLEVNS